MAVMTTQHQSFGSRLHQAICGVCVGVVLFPLSVLLLGWNEFNFVRNKSVLLFVESNVVDVDCMDKSFNSGKGIHLSCPVTGLFDFASDAVVKLWGVKFKTSEAAWLQVAPEIYHYVETKSCEKIKDQLGGGTTEVCSYSYFQKWVSSPVSSSGFYCVQSSGGDGGEDCRMPVEFRGTWKQFGSVNQNTIPNALLSGKVSAPQDAVTIGESYYLNQAEISRFDSTCADISSVLALDNVHTTLQRNGPSPCSVTYMQRPSLSTNDYRATFTMSAVSRGFPVSIIAQQSSGPLSRLQPWDTKKSGTMSVVDWMTLGSSTQKEMIAAKEGENGAQVMILRCVGFVLMFFALVLITGPMAVMPDIIPCIGSCVSEIVGSILCMMNCCVALAVSLVVIGTAWIMARPLFGCGLFLAALCLASGVFYLKEKFKKNQARTAVQMPVEMTIPLTPSMPQYMPVQVQVICPADAYPGKVIPVQALDGRTCQVQIPVGVAPGQAFMVMM